MKIFSLLITILSLVTFDVALAQNNFSQQDIKDLEKKIIEARSDKKNLKSKIIEIKKVIQHDSRTSLMFSESQSKDIAKIIKLMRLDPVERQKRMSGNIVEIDKPLETNEKSYIHLGSIIYLSAKNWVTWINNQKITNRNNNPENEIYVESVQRDQVNLLWQISVTKWKILMGYNSNQILPDLNKNNEIEIRFSLRPNQTFSLSDDKVIEGQFTNSFKSVSKVTEPLQTLEVQ